MNTTSPTHRAKGRARALRALMAMLSVPVTAGTIALTAAAPAGAVTIVGPTSPNFCANYGVGSNGTYAGVKACNGPNLDRIRDKTGCRRRAELTRLAMELRPAPTAPV